MTHNAASAAARHRRGNAANAETVLALLDISAASCIDAAEHCEHERVAILAFGPEKSSRYR